MSDEGESWALFEEPKDFRPPTPPPTETQHVMKNGSVIRLRLVGTHPLWGHYLWNAAPTLTNYLEDHPALVKNQAVLELGAAAALPSIGCVKMGAQSVVATDYPDPDLMGNVRYNLTHNQCEPTGVAEGYIWGTDPASLLAHAPNGFGLILMSDLIFNHQAHPALMNTVDQCLASTPNAQVLVFFSHHRPHLVDRDLAFFDVARERGYVCDKIQEWILQPMFPEDPGDEHVRATVHGYTIRRP
ncbi:nicotinamide n-methyltransferase nnt1 [Malassezia pachydermatis]|uniref:Protein N-terminal and lysine N-methyltransferase EFM7 n=1 Tax=Malassezia pachydermatis TaxID=77020 RepID=A0A0M8MXY4_9BASI|nr:nicotinamide n-methyltransferase nnt1 [Malassezia pachydermatis]KOS16584.1 nicotinamide n-methyltransferase nnt1 [Malassezia pachydermatis]